jgi:undecaprenyl diphosphate synthase
VRNIARKAAAGEINVDDITDDTISNNLTTAGIPDPDLLIRTGGDLRISNFLLWQIAYSEIYVTKTYWPDFSNEDYLDAIRAYASRQRRFGMTGDQIDDINSNN